LIKEISEKVKLPAHRAGLPGKEISFYIVPLDPAYPVLAGRGTFRSEIFDCTDYETISQTRDELKIEKSLYNHFLKSE